MLRRVEEYLGHRRSLGCALPIEGDMLLDFCAHRHEHVFDTHWYLSATPELFVAAANQTSNWEIASLMNRHEWFADLVQTFFFRLPHQSARHK
jgi:hypothetical protein